jgi:hypothetical protein
MDSGITADLVDVWGASGTDVFAVGEQRYWQGEYLDTILHYDGSTWSDLNSVSGRAIWGSSGTDIP